MLAVEFNRPQDLRRDWWRSGEVGADWMEAVLVSGVGQGDALTVGSTVRKATLSGHCRAFGTRSTRRAALMSGDAVTSFEAGKLIKVLFVANVE